MHYSELGNTGIRVSRLCLGTMTFGEQNSEAQSHAQLDLAWERGINFVDTAEIYPVPPKGKTQGRTETFIGNWLSARGLRDRIVLASKVSGPSDWMRYLRGGPRLGAAQVREALHDSLRRLQTDHVDLYQVHWPERVTNYFGRLGYEHDPEKDGIPLDETLEAMTGLVDEGKVRCIGVSNETPWGVMRYLALAAELGLSRIVSIQNPYNLLNRSFEVGLAEIAHRERTGLLAYSPLAFGVLTGKYLGGKRPHNARLTRFKHFDRYDNPRGTAATARYVALAKEAGLSPAAMALAFVNGRPFLTSNIIGATSAEQLEENIGSADVTLSGDVLQEIESIHQEHTIPCP